MNKNLLVIRGSMGAGKSTIAAALVQSGLYDVHYEADMYFETKDGYQWKPQYIDSSHDWCFRSVQAAIYRSLNIIVSNTFIKNEHVMPYKRIANNYGYTYQEMVLLETPYKNIHGVSDERVQDKKRELLENLARLSQ